MNSEYTFPFKIEGISYLKC